MHFSYCKIIHPCFNYILYPRMMAVKSKSMKNTINIKRFYVKCRTWSSFATLYRKNICHGFLFLGISSPPLDHTPLVVHISLPGGHKLSLSGQSIGIQPLDNGQRQRLVVKLEALSDENKQLILALFDIARLAPDSSVADNSSPRPTKPPPIPPQARAGAAIQG